MFSLCAKIFKTRKKSCGKIDGLNHAVPAKLMCFGVIEGLRVTGSACRMFSRLNSVAVSYFYRDNATSRQFVVAPGWKYTDSFFLQNSLLK